MTTALILAGGLLLALLGGWGLHRLLGRPRLTPAERLALTLALLPALLGLAAFAGLLAGRPGPLAPAAACIILGLAGLLAGVTSLRPAAPLPRTGSGEATVVALGAGLYALGALGTTLLTPLSGGALRIGDWVAHWFLVLVYAGQPLPDLRVFTNRVGDFGIISRPPLYNLEGGLLVGALAQVAGDARFWPFQLVTPLLAVPLVAAGILWALALGGRRVALLLAGLSGLSPFLLQNASYPWSKMVAAALVLLFLYLIREAALAHAPARARQTFVLGAFCAGLAYLAHPTSIFYILPSLLWLVWRRPRPLVRWPAAWTLATWALGGLAGLLAFGPWQGWVLATHGLQAALDANPASFGADVSDTLGDWLLKGIVAAIGTLIPLPALAAVARGATPGLDQLLRVQLALLTGALGASGCWLLARKVLTPRKGSFSRLVQRPPWLPLVVLCGFLGQVMLQPNWHDTGDAAESMTPIVVLGLVLVAREALRLGPGSRRLFFGLVLLETAIYLGLWLTWAFSSAWTRDPNAVLASRYGLEHLRGLWGPAVPLGAIFLASGLLGSAAVLWRTLTGGESFAAPRSSTEPPPLRPEEGVGG
ncbi:MAG: hypothetical protein IT306_17425 [Chloroflexi bacterium]|nr:hypothetical protein [Chloroflexota bacterium]